MDKLLGLVVKADVDQAALLEEGCSEAIRS
jgi:hypothetical protein